MDEFRHIPIDELHESPLNPRRHWNDAALQELTASIRQQGVLTPLLARPNAQGFEIAAGHRRYRAARAAGVTTLPVRVRTMDDDAFLEVLAIENLQREDVHPLDEAAGYQLLMTRDRAYTPEAIAARVGKSTSYVYQRLKLLTLIPTARQAFERDAITAAHAVRLARLTPAQQKDALDECFYPIFRRHGEGDEDAQEPAPVSKLDAWIDAHVRIDLAAADTQHYFPEIAEQVAVEREEAGTLLELSDSHFPGAELKTKQHGAIGRGRWTPMRSAKDRCAHVQKGVVVHGGPMRVLEVCATKGCPKHFPVRKTPKGRATAAETHQNKWKAEHEQRERARAAWEALKPAAWKAFAAHVKDVKVTPALIRQVIGPHSLKHVEALTGPLTADNLGQALAVAEVLHGGTWDRASFERVTKPFRFTLKHVKVPAAAPAPAATPRTKTAKIRTAR